MAYAKKCRKREGGEVKRFVFFVVVALLLASCEYLNWENHKSPAGAFQYEEICLGGYKFFVATNPGWWHGVEMHQLLENTPQGVRAAQCKGNQSRILPNQRTRP